MGEYTEFPSVIVPLGDFDVSSMLVLSHRVSLESVLVIALSIVLETFTCQLV